MKKIMYDTIITVMLIVVIFGGATIARLINNNHTREGVVVATHVSNEEVIIVDTTGNEWEYEATGFSIGDNVKMKMFNNYTDNTILDDIITSIKIIH